MSDLSQDERVGVLTTALGDVKLALSRFDGGEALSELFEFRIEAVSESPNIDFNEALGKSVTVKLKTADGKDRYFNGLLAEARWAGSRDSLHAYQLIIRPWLWLLSLTQDCRIFQNLQVPAIIKKVFTDRGLTDFREALQSSYPTLEYCVQYRETDFAFVSRLMEQWGIYYFFEYEDGKHTMVLADMKASHNPAPGLSEVDFIPTVEAGRRAVQHLEDWLRGRSVESGSFKLNEYDYNSPGANLLVDSDKPGGYAHDSMEMYDYPGEYAQRGDGETLVKVEAEAAQSLDDRRTATGTAMSLFPGSLVTLQKHPVGSENQEYLVVGCSHFFDGQRYRSGGAGGQPGYSANFEFTPSSRQFRAELNTDRPHIAGVQSALVVGKQGEEIDVDEQGRICVQFYWDRKKKASRRVRVAQFWAGSHRGAMFLPRIGDEVLVQYEEGNPDRPIVIGSVYNGSNPIPSQLPARKTHSGILTKSSKNSSGYNMLLFEDAVGQEYIKLRSEKDLMFKAMNNEQRTILNSQTEQVGGDETITVGDMTIEAQQIGGNFTLNALKTATINVGPAGSPLTQLLMDTSSITLNVGPQGMASQIVMNMEGITLNVGPSGLIAQIQMGPMGVTISGTPLSQLMVQPSGIQTMTPMIDFMSIGPVSFVTPMVNIPLVTIGAGTCSGLPII